MNKLRAMFNDQPTETELNLIKNTVDMSDASDYRNEIIAILDNSYIGLKPITDTDTIAITSTSCYDTIATCEPYHHDIVYIHKTNCPNCGGLLDGDEHNPYVKCTCCGAKVWSEREVS